MIFPIKSLMRKFLCVLSLLAAICISSCSSTKGIPEDHEYEMDFVGRRPI